MKYDDLIWMLYMNLEAMKLTTLEPVWPTKNGHSISITQFPSLITHHSIFHIRLPSSLNFHHSLFFTLFGGPTPVIVQLFFFFPLAASSFFFFPPGLAVRSGFFFFFSLSLVSLGTKEKRKKKKNRTEQTNK